MSRRNSKADAALFMVAIVVGIPLFLIGKVVEAIGGPGAIILLIAIVGVVIWYRQNKKKKQQEHEKERKKERLEYLWARYGDESVIQKILEGSVWQGQSREQLEDSMGSPVGIDQNVLKTKTNEIWKYHERGENRFGLRVILEDGYVIGWDKKS